MKRTWNPNKRRRQKRHGFFKRMFTMAGKRILKNRRRKGRKKLAV